MRKMPLLAVGSKSSSKVLRHVGSLDKLEHFEHKPLDLDRPTIRVLTVLPGKAKSIIECKLWHIELTDDAHTCLSYMWGSDEPAHAILINGKLLKVRRNLRDFLHRARQFSISEPLWVDAICIDQQNVTERNHQVQQMAKIYSKATQLLIYPGSLWNGFARLGQKASDLDFFEDYTKAEMLKVWLVLLSKSWQNLRTAIVDRMPYWKRVWIVQEVLLAKTATIMIGNKMVRWSEFMASTVEELPGSSKYRIPHPWRPVRMIELASLRSNGKELEHPDDPTYDGWSFMRLLVLVQGSGCSDVRDRVYGIKGMCTENNQIRVDYGEDAVSTMLRVALEVRPPSLYWLSCVVFDLSYALEVCFTVICSTCFWKTPSETQARMWPALDQRTIGLPDQIFL